MAIFWTVEDMALFFYPHDALRKMQMMQQKCEFLQPSEMPSRKY